MILSGATNCNFTRASHVETFRSRLQEHTYTREISPCHGVERIAKHREISYLSGLQLSTAASIGAFNLDDSGHSFARRLYSAGVEARRDSSDPILLRREILQ